MKMTSKERIRAISERKRTDRPGSSLRCTPEAWEALREHLNVKTNQQAMDILDIDIRFVSLPFIGPRDRSATPLGSEGTDFWGCHTRRVSNEYNTYFEFDYHPLQDAKTVEDVRAHDWPELDWWNYSTLSHTIEEINQNGERSILFFAGGTFETPWYIRGLEPFLMDLHTNPEIVQEICTHVGDYYEARAHRALEVAGEHIDIIGSGGDIGTQRGMMISPEIWRTQIKKHAGRLITPFKKKGYITFYHSCGSITPVINDFIELGLDLLEPIQVSAADMEPSSLAQRFGPHISFHGGIDEQKVLPHGTPGEVYENTISMIDRLGKYNGYVVAPCHQAQNDTAPENLVAVFDAVRDYPKL
jgi:uroporphyrinogen decarboxylase